MIIYPAVDIKNGRCVRLLQGRFDRETVYGDDPVEIAEKWALMGSKWLHVVDLDGARSGFSKIEAYWPILLKSKDTCADRRGHTHNQRY